MQRLAGAEIDERERFAAIGEIAAEMAHELQNVLQTIASSAHVGRLEAARGNAGAAEPHLLKIERNARAAHCIVDDVMALARGEPLDKEKTPFADIVSMARVEVGSGAASWDDTALAPRLDVRVNPRLLARLLHVLYENAVRASAPHEPTITTRAWSDRGRVIVEVADDGPGVPPSIASRMFEPLVTARPGGSGLGLALARRIAAAHGGTIQLSTSRGQGATFRVELPETV